jgi:transcriptional regulator with XRE-family HTH domain
MRINIVGKIGGWEPTGFGANLRKVREEKGLSQRELAVTAECNANTIAKLERGEQEPAWPLVLALAKALGVDCTAFNVTPATSSPERSEVERPAPAPPGPGGIKAPLAAVSPPSQQSTPKKGKGKK